MPNKNKKSSANKRHVATSQRATIKWVVVVMVAVIIGLVVYFSIAWYQGYQLRQAEKKVDQLMSLITDKLGQPVTIDKDRSCSHASAKYSKGRLGCGFSNSIYYSVKNVDQAKEYVARAQTLVNNSDLVRVTYSRTPDKGFDGSIDSIYNTPVDDIRIQQKLMCSITYKLMNSKTYSSQRKLTQEQLDKSPYVLYIRGGCGTNPLRPVFPVQD